MGNSGSQSASLDLLDAIHEFMIDVGIFCHLPLPVPYELQPYENLHKEALLVFEKLRGLLQCNVFVPELVADVNKTEIDFASILPAINQCRDFLICPLFWQNSSKYVGMTLLLYDKSQKVQWYFDPTGKVGNTTFMENNGLYHYEPRIVQGTYGNSTLQQAIKWNCQSLLDSQCGEVACFLFAAVAFRFGVRSLDTLAETLVAWFHRPEGPVSDAFLGHPHRERCEMGVRLILWYHRLSTAADEAAVLQLLGLKVPRKSLNWGHRWRPCAVLLPNNGGFCGAAAVDSGPCHYHRKVLGLAN